MKKVKEVIEKVQKFRKSAAGQKIEKAAVKAGTGFLKESGLGKMGADKVNSLLEKHTKNNPTADAIRSIAHASVSNYFQEKEPLPSPKESSVVGTPTMKPKPYLHPSPRSARSEHEHQR